MENGGLASSCGPTSDDNLLIVSDLHLSQGRDPNTNRLSPNEDFLFDEEFARFLAYYSDPSRRFGRPWHLIINGDFLDFLQVTCIEGAAEELSRDRRKYGLGCGEPESVFKLKRIFLGHQLLFAALAKFLDAGNSVTIIRGNHDVELYYHEVQAAFRTELAALTAPPAAIAAAAAGASASTTRPVVQPRGTVRFCDWFYYEPGLLGVEHGNQYDELNCFENWLAPLLPSALQDPRRKSEIDLPWGSVFVRYLFNPVEKKEPFADNIKPQTRFISWFFAHHPIRALKFLFRDGNYMVGKMKRAWGRVSHDDHSETHQQRLSTLARQWRIDESDLKSIDALRASSVFRNPKSRIMKFMRFCVRARLFWPLVFGGLLLSASVLVQLGTHLLVYLFPILSKWITHPASQRFSDVLQWVLITLVAAAGSFWLGDRLFSPKPVALPERAEKIADTLKVRYVLMGHTHDADLQPMGKDGGPHQRWYLNTGTWTKVFSPEERLVREENELVFVQCLRGQGGLQVDLLKWQDQAREPRLVKLFT